MERLQEGVIRVTELSFHAADASGALVLRDAQGAEYRLRVDDELLAAVRRLRTQQATRTYGRGQLRPKAIQAMIRSGLTAEEVADATGGDLDHIKAFEQPVLAERRHIAHSAGQSPVYEDGSRDHTPRPLRDVATERLEKRGADTDSLQWDAWRSDEGVWNVELAFTVRGTQKTARWEYRERNVHAIDDEARWLSEAGPADSGPIPNFGSPDERVFDFEDQDRTPKSADHQAETGRILESLRRRRARTQEAESAQAPTGLRSVPEMPETEPDGAHTALSRPEEADDDSVLAVSPPEEEHTDAQPSLLDEPGVFDGGDATASAQPAEQTEQKEAKRGRSSVPSWDEIMFGTKRD